MEKKKINIDQSYRALDENQVFNTDIDINESVVIPDVEFDDVYDDLDFMDQYKDNSEEDDEYAGQ